MHRGGHPRREREVFTMRTIRNLRQWAMKHGFTLVISFVAAGYGLSLLKPGPVTAAPEDRDVAALKKVALSDVSLGERLAALNILEAKGGSEAEDALAAIAGKGSLPVAAAACAQLGRSHSSSSKDLLKNLLENDRLDKTVRMAAASCIAEHWKDRGDISYLREKCEGDAALNAHRGEIESRVYGR